MEWRWLIDGIDDDWKKGDGKDDGKEEKGENGEKAPVKKRPVVWRVNDRWEIGVAQSEDGQFRQMSFVNSICTEKGGTHVNYVVNQLVKGITPIVERKLKGASSKPIFASHIKNQLWVFVNNFI